jgi:hypothetical protein
LTFHTAQVRSTKMAKYGDELVKGKLKLEVTDILRRMLLSCRRLKHGIVKISEDRLH